MSELTETELEILSVMYEGDRSRDASSKIRGFIFQDYVTAMCLLESDVAYVCSEYLEDVDVFFTDGTFEFIQVKYYPKSSPNMEEISTDLYYQYLRLKILHSNLKAIPKLYIHGKSIEKPTLDKMKGFIGLENELQESVKYPNNDNAIIWLKETINKNPKIKKKTEQKKKLFEEMASLESLDEFLKVYSIKEQEDINQYKKKLMDKLSGSYPNPCENGNEMNWKLILLGLAISYIQRRYILDDTSFEELRVDKNEFNQYMFESVKTRTDQTIKSYLVGIVSEQYVEIISHNDLSELQTLMLNLIYHNTICWINDLGSNVDGQYRLLNTFSMDEADKVAGYRDSSIDDRLMNMAENKPAFIVFLGYLWKIILNIGQENVTDKIKISENQELFDPRHYIDTSVTGYVCLNFPKDKYVKHSIILPQAGGKFRSLKRKIIGRIVKMSPKPGKWYFENSKISKGENFYGYSTANVNNKLTVADLGEEGFYIECMNCIGIDDNDWGTVEDCGNCIFSERCVKER